MTRHTWMGWACAAALATAGCAGTSSLPLRKAGNWSLPAATQPQPTASAPASPSVDATDREPPRTEYYVSEANDPTSASTQPVTASAGKRYQLDFHDADIKAVVDAVLGDILKVGYTVAPQVQGKITVRTGRPVERDALLSALEAALESVSAAMVAQADGSYQVLPLDAVPQRVRGMVRGAAGQRAAPGYAVEIVPLRYVGAKEMQRVLEVFAPKGAVLQADDSHNHVVIVGSSVDREAMLRTIEGFDTDGMKGMSFALYKLENLSPAQLVAELKDVFQPPAELIGNRVRLVPIDRMQAVLGIAPHGNDLRTLETWVRRLDVARKTGERGLYVYNVQNGRARELAASLQLVMNGESPPATGAPQGSGNGARGDGQPAPVPAVGSTRVGQSRVVANEDNNSLLIFGTESEYRLIRDAVVRLDVLPRQVLIEAILAEVTLGDDLRYGVQWFFDSNGSQATFSTNSSGSVGAQFPGFSYIYTGWTHARAVINALQSRTDVKVLSAPRLAVLNNQKASLQVGDEVPILTQLTQGTAAPGSPVVSSIQMRDTGVMLEVTPRINENGNVILDVTQEVSDVTSTTSSGIDSPTIQRRSLRSVIATRDGATVALGGLIRETGTRQHSGIPLLKDLPYIGSAFRSDSILTRRTELIVLLVPHVMRDAEETRITAEALINSVDAASEVASHATPILRKPPPN